MKNIFLSICLIAFSSISFGQVEQAPKSTKSGSAEFSFTSTDYLFGKVKQGDLVHGEFTFTNSGKEPLVISSAAGSCGCTVPDWPKEPIMGGKSASIKFTFNTAGKMGMQDKTITLRSNASNDPLVLHVKGNIVTKEEYENQMPLKKESDLSPIEKK
ncbi:MAG TPA: DUF1573 domain-containing protein [Bacteroidia bacterium]|nr:DUF1573 domain-containing protein [Bacteroidia bacterium]HNT79482.1 DUF1573 domain-containing protein [Bacteroidia bacterium]